MLTKRYYLLGLLLAVTCSAQLNAQKIKTSAKPAGTVTKTVQVIPIISPATAASAKPLAVSCSNPNGLAAAEIEQILAIHNKARTEIGSPLLTWNCALADFAQDWANKGVAQHRKFSDYGENIFVADDPKIAAIDSVNKWLNERPQWNNAAGSCAAGKTCTHYTQIVWKRTTKIGCGINRNASGKWKVMIVCNYDPAGNDQPGAAF